MLFRIHAAAVLHTSSNCYLRFEWRQFREASAILHLDLPHEDHEPELPRLGLTRTDEFQAKCWLWVCLKFSLDWTVYLMCTKGWKWFRGQRELYDIHFCQSSLPKKNIDHIFLLAVQTRSMDRQRRKAKGPRSSKAVSPLTSEQRFLTDRTWQIFRSIPAARNSF